MSEGGQVSFGGFEKFELDSILFTMIEFHREFSYHTAQQIYSRGLCRWVLAGGITAEEFISELRKEVLSYNKKVPFSYVLVTSVSSVEGFPIRVIRSGEATVECFPKGLPKKYESRECHKDRWKFSSPPMPENYCPVVVRFKSKNYMDGVENALYELDFVRGVFALDLNAGFQISLSSSTGNLKPINKLTLGGMHTLHKVNGAVFDKNIYWFDPGYEEQKVLSIDAERRKRAKKFFSFVTQALNRHKDGYVIKDSIVRYVRAFDLADKNSTIQRAWAALESIMAPGENNTDKIVARCSFMYADREYRRQILEHIKEYRNRNVHTGHTIDDVSPHCYQIQKFFRSAVLFHLSEVDTFGCLADANRFLELSDSIDELVKQRAMIDKAISFRTPR